MISTNGFSDWKVVDRHSLPDFFANGSLGLAQEGFDEFTFTASYHARESPVPLAAGNFGF
jgi:hypothetical protein